MNNIMISINLDTGAVDVNNPSATGNTEAKPNVFRAESKYLALKILDAGLIDSLCGVEYDEKSKRKVFVFDNNQDVKDVYLKWFQDRKIEKQHEYEARKTKRSAMHTEEGTAQ